MRKPRHKYPPCPVCLIFEVETWDHRACGNGPPPPHGAVCNCWECDGDRLDAIFNGARKLMEHPRSTRARAALAAAFKAHDEHPALRDHFWKNQQTIILATFQLRQREREAQGAA